MSLRDLLWRSLSILRLLVRDLNLQPEDQVVEDADVQDEIREEESAERQGEEASRVRLQAMEVGLVGPKSSVQ